MSRSNSRRQGEEAQAESEARIRRFLMRVPVALAQLGSDGTFLNINDRFVQLFGYTLDDLRRVEDWWPRAYPDPAYRQEVMDVWAAAVQRSVLEGIDIPGREYSVTCKNGEVRLVEVSGVMLPDELIVTLFDVTERRRAEQAQKRLNRELHAVTECNQALMRAEDEQALLDEICRIICEAAGYPVACVAYAEQDVGRSIRVVARNGVDAGFFAGIPLTWSDRDIGRGPLGAATRTGLITEVPDLAASDPLTVPWRDRALAHGYRSAVAFPLKDDRQLTFGALLICSGEAHAITAEEVRLLDGLANDLAFGITALRIRAERRKAEVQLIASEQLFRALVENAPDFILRYDLDLRRTYLNPAVRKLFDVPLEQILGQRPNVLPRCTTPSATWSTCRRRSIAPRNSRPSCLTAP